MNSSEMIFKILENNGVEYIFGVPGAAIVPEAVAMKNSSIKVITTCHEAGAARMAHGYAWETGKLGVAIATAGPGGANFFHAAVAAQADSIPLLLIVGEVPTDIFGKGASQESSSWMQKSYGTIAKKSWLITNSGLVQSTFEEAINVATTPPYGVSVVCLPANIAKTEMKLHEKIKPISKVEFTQNDLGKTVEILKKAENPLILAGSGVVISKAADELVTFAESINASVITAPKAKGIFPESHPLSLGVYGVLSEDTIEPVASKNHEFRSA